MLEYIFITYLVLSGIVACLFMMPFTLDWMFRAKTERINLLEELLTALFLAVFAGFLWPLAILANDPARSGR